MSSAKGFKSLCMLLTQMRKMCGPKVVPCKTCA